MTKVLLALLLIGAPLCAGNDFDDLVRSMEANYGKKKVYIPMLGFANFVVKLAKPAGTSDLKVAMFENVDGDKHPQPEELDRRFRSSGWKPFVKVTTRTNGERVAIYARQANRDHELLIATFENTEAVLVRVRVNPERLARWVNHPALMAKTKGRAEAD